jgi:hypothetical protein
MTGPTAGRQPPDEHDGQAPPARAYLVTVHDSIDARIAGHRGRHYTSPRHTRADALALIELLVGERAGDQERARWTQAIPGGRRTITLTPADPPPARTRRSA